MWIIVTIIVAAAVAYAIQPRMPEAPRPTLDNFSAPTAEEGRPVPIVFGTCVVKSPNIVWYGDLGYSAIKTDGGK